MNEQNLYYSPYVANRIKDYAKCKKISLKSILEDCKLGSNTFSHMSHGKSIAFDSLAKIADYLGCSVDYLLGRSENPNITNSISNSNTTVNGTQANIITNSEPLDEMMSELVKKFNALSFDKKIEVFNYIKEISS